jgi:hypothetical protein
MGELGMCRSNGCIQPRRSVQKGAARRQGGVGKEALYKQRVDFWRGLAEYTFTQPIFLFYFSFFFLLILLSLAFTFIDHIYNMKPQVFYIVIFFIFDFIVYVIYKKNILKLYQEYTTFLFKIL